jgi:hypothetical protein
MLPDNKNQQASRVTAGFRANLQSNPIKGCLRTPYALLSALWITSLPLPLGNDNHAKNVSGLLAFF